MSTDTAIAPSTWFDVAKAAADQASEHAGAFPNLRTPAMGSTADIHSAIQLGRWQDATRRADAEQRVREADANLLTAASVGLSPEIQAFACRTAAEMRIARDQGGTNG